MNLPKGETRQELLNRAFLYVLIIAFSVLIFLRVKSLIFDLFVAVVLAALAEPVVYRLTKKISRQSAALVAVSLILLVIGATLFSIIPIMVQEIYFLSSQMPTYFDNFINYLNVEGFAVSSQSLDLENQFNSFIKDYGSTVGSSVVFAGLDDGLFYVKEGDKIFSEEHGNVGGAEGLAVVPKGQEEAVVESAEECPGECIMIEP